MKTLTDYVTFNDPKLERKYATKRIPMSVLYEAYFDGDIDIKCEMGELIANRNLFVEYTLTKEHFKWAVTNFVPEVAIHSKSQDKRIVREHYDRGNDFFGWFLGERMVYTSGFFETPGQSLEQAQDNKMHLVCQKLGLEPGHRLLDIGCGWGTLISHAAKHYGVDATGVTIAERQTEFGNQRAKDWGVSDRARVLCTDYREIPKQKFDRIVSLEMVEHVGVKNLDTSYTKLRSLLEDKGLFLLQWTGLRRAAHQEDLVWGLFMAKYIFPGADASLPVAQMLAACEKSNWEIHTVDNISIHYCYTIKKWHDNWLAHEAAIKASYGERWFRIWNFFLAWAVVAGTQGTAACFQVVMNKNLNEYDRARWVGREGLAERMSLPTHGRSNGVEIGQAE
jgi:cyclopropane fatty-acyl-phospholipid synthase-like methyltransferase